MSRLQHNPTSKLDFQVATGYPQMGRREDDWNVDGVQIEGSGVWAVNRQMKEAEPGEMDYGKGWNVTHLPTRFALVANLPDRKLAVAIAERVEKLGWGQVGSSNPAEAAKQLRQLGATDLKTFVVAALHQKVAPSKLAAKMAKWKPGSAAVKAEKKAAKRTAPAPKPPKKKAGKKPAPRKAPPKTKKAKRAPARKKPPPSAPAKPLSLLELARRAREGNPGDLDESGTSAKARCLW